MSLKTTLFLIISIISVSAQALKPHIAKYQLSINGLKIAEEVRTLHQLDDEYFYTANAKTTGIAALIKKYSVSASSEFFIDQLGYVKAQSNSLSVHFFATFEKPKQLE